VRNSDNSPIDPIVDGVLGLFDTTLLANGTYLLRLTAQDTGGNTRDDYQIVNVAGELKLGNFNLAFQDLVLPFASIPIVISRSYDTLNAGVSDDFGYGWRLNTQDTKLTVQYADESPGIFSDYIPFRDGTRVLVTHVDGKTEGFTFYGQPAQQVAGITLAWKPSFVPDPGVKSQLEANPVLLQKQGQEYFTVNGEGGMAYNPAQPAFGGFYTLTVRNGNVFTVDARTGKTLDVTDIAGNSLSFGYDGIVASNGARVDFERDFNGRITAIVDPLGRRIRYDYDSRGDLVAVTDREDATTQFEYDPARPHHIQDIINAKGERAATAEYGSSGRLSGVVDPFGKTVQTVYDSVSRTRTVIDQLGHPTTSTFDVYGNEVATLNAENEPTTRTFDAASHLLLSETNALGHTTSFTYDTAGNRLTSTDALGETSRFTYNSRGQVLTQTNPLGDTVRTSYFSPGFSFSGRVASITDAAGGEQEFSYSVDGKTVFAVSPTGAASTTIQTPRDFELGEVFTTTGPLGSQSIATYNEFGELLSLVVNGLETTHTYDNEGRVDSTTTSAGTTSSVYDALGRQTHSTDVFGRTTEYVYDEAGRLYQTILPDETPNNPDDNLRRTTEYFDNGTVKAQIDERGNRTEFRYDRVGRLKETILPDETPGDLEDNPRVYSDPDAAGRVVQDTYLHGNETTQVYDSTDNVIETQLPTGLRVRTAYDAPGQVIAQTDPYLLGSAARGTLTRYDAAGRMIESRRVEDLVIDITTVGSVAYSSIASYGDTVSVSSSEFSPAGELLSSTDEAGATTTYEYDELGRQKAVINELDQRTEYEYGLRGHLKLARDAKDHETEFEYNDLGQVTKTTFHDGTSTSSHYNEHGQKDWDRDALSQQTDYEYHFNGQLSAVTLPATTDINPDSPYFNQVVRPSYEYDYDEFGNRVLIRDNVVMVGTTRDASLARETHFKFDDFNREESRTLPLGVATPNLPDDFTEHRHYNLDGSLDYTVDFEGRVTAYEDDQYGRLKFKRFYASEADYDSGAGTPGQTVTYGYNDQGELESISDSLNGLITRTYDTDGRITQEASPEGIINHEFDPATGQLVRTFTSSTIAATDAITDTRYRYDVLGRLEHVTVVARAVQALAQPEVTTYHYDAVGNLERLDRHNGVITQYVFDDLNRLDLQTDYGPDGTPNDLANNPILASYDYTVREDGKRTQVVEHDAAGRTNVIDWEYDELGRLTEEVFDSSDDALDFTDGYLFDWVGNRLAKTHDAGSNATIDEQTTSLHDLNDRLLEETLDLLSGVDTESTYSYGPSNSGTALTGKEIRELASNLLLSETAITYNLQGKQASFVQTTFEADGATVASEIVTSYRYNDAGDRIEQTVDDGASEVVTRYVIDANNLTGYAQVFEERDSSGAVTRSYAIGHDVLAQADGAAPALTLLTDGHGSTRALATAAGAIAQVNSVPQVFAYDAYGNALGFALHSAATSHLYSGEQTDHSTGQQYLRARYYASGTGEFSTLDPFVGNFALPQSLHKYLYAHSDPINGFDPSGMMTLTEMKAVVGTAFGTVDKLVLNASISAHGSVTVAIEGYPLVATAIFYGSTALALFGMYLDPAGSVPSDPTSFADEVWNSAVVAKKGVGLIKGAISMVAQPDRWNRSTGVVARLTRESLRSDLGSFAEVDPEGWADFKATVDATKRARAHLLARVFGGSGNWRHNLVPFYQSANLRMRLQAERPVQLALERGDFEAIWYRACPRYEGHNPIPVAIDIEAVGETITGELVPLLKLPIYNTP